MKKVTVLKYSFVLFFFIAITSCSSNSEEIVGLDVSGTSFNGKYMLDKTYTKGVKYIHESDETKRIITYDIAKEGLKMWGLMVGNTLYYKIEQNGAYPPESQWDCGIGIDKDKFKIAYIYND